MNDKNLFILFIFCLCSIIVAQNIYAQADTLSVKEYNLSEIVVSSQRIPTNYINSPQKIELISAKKIESVNGRKLSDILKTSPQIVIKSYGHGSSLQTISINGLGAEHTLVLLDGLRINSFQNPGVDLSLIPKSLIREIEVLTNGSGALYGSGAMGGVVNIKTTQNSLGNKNFRAELDFERGSFGTEYLGFSSEARITNILVKATGSREFSRGNFEYFYNDGISKIKKEREGAQYSSEDASISLTYFPNNSSRVRLFSYYINSDKNLPGIETGSSSTSTTQKDKVWNNYIHYENILSGNYNFNAILNYSEHQNQYFAFNKSTHNNFVYSFSTRHNLSFGQIKVQAGYDFAHAVLNSTEMDFIPIKNQNSVFIASELNVVNKLTLFPSVRYEKYSGIKDGIVTGSLGMNYQVINKKLILKVSGGNSFRNPSFNDLYWEFMGNPNLYPEKSINAEGGVLIFPFETHNLGFELNYTFIKAENKIVWQPTNLPGIWSPVNLAESESNVLSLNLNYSHKFSSGLNLTLNNGLVFNRSINSKPNFKNDPGYGKQIFYIPKNSYKLNILVNYSSVGLNLFYEYTGPRYSDKENKRILPVYHIVNANISNTFSIYETKAKIKFEINNLFNADYFIISGYPMPLRNYSLNFKLTY